MFIVESQKEATSLSAPQHGESYSNTNALPARAIRPLAGVHTCCACLGLLLRAACARATAGRPPRSRGHASSPCGCSPPARAGSRSTAAPALGPQQRRRRCACRATALPGLLVCVVGARAVLKDCMNTTQVYTCTDGVPFVSRHQRPPATQLCPGAHLAQSVPVTAQACWCGSRHHEQLTGL